VAPGGLSGPRVSEGDARGRGYTPAVDGFGDILTAMVTPFDGRGALDEAAAARLMGHLVRHGSDGVVLAGTTGEASTLTDDEKTALFAIGVSELGGRAAVIAGTGSNDTAHSVHLTERAARAGADAVLAVTPYYNRPPRAGLIAHFRAIAAVGVPVILYNIPSRTTLNMDPGLIAELGEIPGIVGVKQANPELAEARAVRERTGLALYAGNDDMLLPVAQMGGAGVISVASHLVGERMAEVAATARAGDAEEAERLDAALRPLYEALFVTSNPILVKAALHMIGLIPTPELRLPLVQATPVEREILRAVLEQQGVPAHAA
jgi:4-hydroxy-tetrahydrodipicolinate synthase